MCNAEDHGNKKRSATFRRCSFLALGMVETSTAMTEPWLQDHAHSAHAHTPTTHYQ